MGALISIATGVIALAGLCTYAEARAEADDRQREKDDEEEKRRVLREEKRLERAELRVERRTEEDEAEVLTEDQIAVWTALFDLDLVLTLSRPAITLKGVLLAVKTDHIVFDVGTEDALTIAYPDISKVEIAEPPTPDNDAD